MHVRFLLGPAGSGKTFRCLAEIRAALAASAQPGGGKAGDAARPLILVAPKQATFQLERQLLAGDEIAGYSRLEVLSFDRLAQFVFERLRLAPPKLLSDEGRIMVLRALLRQHESGLKLLRGSARRPGFAQELAGQLAELQQHQLGPTRLRELAADQAMRRELRDKLLDLALLAEKYAEWLERHELQDMNRLLDSATELLLGSKKGQGAALAIEGLWLDGFAEMTPQEHALLAAVIPYCDRAMLAFCVETEPTPAMSWLSIWSTIGKTFQRCRDRLGALPGCAVQTEILPRMPGRNRFPEQSALGALEASWALAVAPHAEAADVSGEIEVTACAGPEAEAVYAAREVLKFVRSNAGNRFRDCAVLVRSLENYHQPLARIFRRYEIPFFLDRRESVAHHPLAELTRSALWTVAGDWRHDDWFAALKAGFSPLPEADIDRLENLALEYGWRGRQWLEPLRDDACEGFRQRILPPFEAFHQCMQRHRMAPTGTELAEAIGVLWSDLAVEATLEKWSLVETDNPSAIVRQASLHQTVFDQMKAWLDNVAMAFPREPLPLRDWLPVLEAGLANLTVGVIPPALDEVLVGAIDRARNPDLKFALLLGVNESVFPAPPARPTLLTNADRDELDRQNAAPGPNVLDQISRERYLGYIACTRANQKLALTFARQGAGGRAMNPSPFISHLQRNFPSLKIGEFSGMPDWREAVHAVELGQLLSGRGTTANAAALKPGGQPELFTFDAGGETGWNGLLNLPVMREFADKLRQLREPEENEELSPALAEKLYGPMLKTSVSRLEEFAQCPFRFFVHSGLRAEERKKFELDARERGSFQHEILKSFHDQLTAEGKRWRDVTPTEARERIGRIAESLASGYRDGLLQADHESRFASRALTAALQDFVETLVAWMRGQYQFDPTKAETGFGLDHPGLPAWKINLSKGHKLALRGRVDRIDLCSLGDQSLAVVMDYKSGARKLDNVLVEHGIQLQLLAYLAAVRQWPAEFFGARMIIPAGVFYVNLKGQFESGDSRADVLADVAAARRLAYRHSGRFDARFLDKLDHGAARDQFNYQLNKDGSVRSNSAEALSCKEFTSLLDQVEEQLRTLGESIYSGAASVDPYRKGTATACEYCDYRAVCRIDEWTHEFRELRAKEKSAAPVAD